MKILLPVDGSDYTKRMLAYIAARDELLGAGHEYVALTVVAAVPAHAAGFVDADLVTEHYRDEAHKVLGPIKAFFAQQGWKARFLHAHGHAAEEIAAVADRERPGLIVMGTHGHSEWGNVLLGSVATGVISRCKVPVLLIR